MVQHTRRATAALQPSSPSSPEPNTALCSAVNDNDRIDSRGLVMNLGFGEERDVAAWGQRALTPRAKRWPPSARDGALLAFGGVLGALLICVGSHLVQPGGGAGSAGAPGIPAKAANTQFLVPERSDRFDLAVTSENARGRRYAYVLMAYDAPGKPPEYIWRAAAMVRALQRLSDYPTLVLTNSTGFPDGTSVKPAFEKLGARVLPVQTVPLPKSIEQSLTPERRVAYWKLQIWRLTEYEKLIWLDVDAVLTRSMDHLFELEPPWAQRDLWVCSQSKGDQDWPSSGAMLIKPSEETYQGLVSFAARSKEEWWAEGDHRLLQLYFREAGTPVKLLGLNEAAFGKCLGVVPNLFNETRGETWNMPAFVHKSSAKDECFYFRIFEQLRQVDGRTVNVCHYHPLGSYWRELFCQGLQLMEVKLAATEAYCDDFLWHRHR